MKRLSYEPLIVHLFKIFSRALKLKSDKSATEISATIDDKQYRSPKDYDEQKKEAEMKQVRGKRHRECAAIVFGMTFPT